jgi:hypothetical protein
MILKSKSLLKRKGNALRSSLNNNVNKTNISAVRPTATKAKILNKDTKKDNHYSRDLWKVLTLSNLNNTSASPSQTELLQANRRGEESRSAQNSLILKRLKEINNIFAKFSGSFKVNTDSLNVKFNSTKIDFIVLYKFMLQDKTLPEHSAYGR